MITLHLTVLASLLSTTHGQDKFCSDYNDYGYACVPYYQCNKENKIITDGAGLFDPRTGYDCKKGNDNMIANTKNNDDDDDDTAELRHDLARTSRCNRLLEVCCLHPSCDTDESPTIPTRPGTRTGPEPPTEPEPPTPGTCGKRNKDGIVQAQNLKVKRHGK